MTTKTNRPTQDLSTLVDDEAKRMKSYTVRMIAKMLRVVPQTVRNRVEQLKMKNTGKVLLKGRKGRPTLTYSKDQVEQLKNYAAEPVAVWVAA